jgi:CSLREA domain-containing protein
MRIPLLHVARAMALAAVLLTVLLPAAGTTLASGVIQVTTTQDVLATDSLCSLREAVRSANLDQPIGGCTAGSGNDTIDVPAGTYVLTIAGRNENVGLTGDLDIKSRLTLRGAGADATTIDGGYLDRVVQVHEGSRVTIDGVTITGGSLPGTISRSPRSSGAGIANFANLMLVSSVVTDNRTTGYVTDIGQGGGVFNSGTLTVRNSTISHNSAGAGGGIYSTGSSHVSRTLIEWNSASGYESHPPIPLGPDVADDQRPAGGDAGGITASGYLSVQRSVIRFNNGGEEWGHGGIAMERGVINGSLIIRNHSTICGTGGVSMTGARLVESTVALNNNGNCGPGAGGVYAVDSEIVNTTISSNSSNGLAPGGILAERSSIVSSTITLNRSGLGDVGFMMVGGLYGDDVTLRNTIVANNLGGTGYPDWEPHPDCDGTGMSLGNNLIGSIDGCEIEVAANDTIGTSARLGRLADNGGPKAGPEGSLEAVLTHTLRPGSPAIDAWYDGSVGSGASCPRYDQRGVHRPQDGNGDGIAKCDIGALEWMR